MTRRSARRREITRESALETAPQSAPAGVKWSFAKAAVVLAALAAVCYANSLQTPFLFDSLEILNSPAIHRLVPPKYLTHSGARPIVMFTFALNYAVDGLRPFGYHFVNIVIHWAAACLVFYVVRETLRRSRLPELQSAASSLALVIAAAWFAHPLQTNAVTNVVQRLEALMSLCVLATIACFLRAADSPRPALWYGLSILAAAIGVGCKEPAAMAPLLVLCFDRLLFASSFRDAFQRKPRYYAGLFATWMLFAALLNHAAPSFAPSGVGSADALSPRVYLQTQAGVILLYLRLTLIPLGLTADYGLPYVTSFAQAALYGLVIVAFLTVAIYGFVRGQTWSLAGCWFFLILAPSSSLLPIRDAAFEHRMYLPSVAVIALLICGVYFVLLRVPNVSEFIRARLMSGSAVLYLAALCLGTIVRNQDYASPTIFYADNLVKTPLNPRVNYNLGLALLLDQRPADALPHLERAVELDPNYVRYRRGLALALERNGRARDAVRELEACVERDPAYAEAWIALSELLEADGDLAGAERAVRTANDLQPMPESLYNEGALIMRRGGQPADAAAKFRRALALDPTFQPARQGLERLATE